jgi:hypothetical protein
MLGSDPGDRGSNPRGAANVLPRGGEMGTQRSAKPSRAGSIPVHASNSIMLRQSHAPSPLGPMHAHLWGATRSDLMLRSAEGASRSMATHSVAHQRTCGEGGACGHASRRPLRGLLSMRSERVAPNMCACLSASGEGARRGRGKNLNHCEGWYSDCSWLSWPNGEAPDFYSGQRGFESCRERVGVDQLEDRRCPKPEAARSSRAVDTNAES